MNLSQTGITGRNGDRSERRRATHGSVPFTGVARRNGYLPLYTERLGLRYDRTTGKWVSA